jgi:Rps23 Pro-64 3,4-dihydroxylase Tpa1-like proline 4-hydroxylase
MTIVKDKSIFCLDSEYLKDLAEKYRDAYAAAHPFPHVVIDNFLPETVLNEVLEQFPSPDQIRWQKYQNTAEKKLASRHEEQMGDAIRTLLYQLNSSTFISFLEQLTGIEGIIPDPHFDGGGLHQIERGGFLKMHVDFNRHARLKLDRRLNLLIYLNKDWEESYGGYLELWDSNMTACEQKILPIFNRCVVFTTNDFSYHGHPEPLNCPEDRTRKSLALYYYSNGRPASDLADGDGHSTIFKSRPDEDLGQMDASKAAKPSMKETLKRFVPPIVWDLKSGQN